MICDFYDYTQNVLYFLSCLPLVGHISHIFHDLCADLEQLRFYNRRRLSGWWTIHRPPLDI